MRSIFGFLALFLCCVLWANDPDLQIYKEVDGYTLKLHIFTPSAHAQDKELKPAIVFFFGGGWVGGTPTQFYPQCQHLARRGMVAISAEYRVKSRHQATPFDCVEDGKSALRWVRTHAKKIGVDPKRIAGGGGSAGGHVAVAVATVPGLDAEGDDLSVSCMPDALVLFNPVYDNGPGGFGYAKLKDRYREISPMHNLREDMAPTIVFLGDQDSLIPVSTAEKFRDGMRKLGNRSELFVYPGQPHGFFNQGKPGDGYAQTLAEMDRFLVSLGWIKPV
jgi:acetyl esterase